MEGRPRRVRPRADNRGCGLGDSVGELPAGSHGRCPRAGRIPQREYSLVFFLGHAGKMPYTHRLHHCWPRVWATRLGRRHLNGPCWPAWPRGVTHGVTCSAGSPNKGGRCCPSVAPAGTGCPVAGEQPSEWSAGGGGRKRTWGPTRVWGIVQPGCSYHLPLVTPPCAGGHGPASFDRAFRHPTVVGAESCLLVGGLRLRRGGACVSTWRKGRADRSPFFSPDAERPLMYPAGGDRWDGPR